MPGDHEQRLDGDPAGGRFRPLRLTGGDGNDQLCGAAGNSIGGTDNDLLTGDDGRNIFMGGQSRGDYLAPRREPGKTTPSRSPTLPVTLTPSRVSVVAMDGSRCRSHEAPFPALPSGNREEGFP